MEGGPRIEKDTLKHEGLRGKKTFSPKGLKASIVIALTSAAAAMGIGAPSDEEIERRDREERLKRPEIVNSPPEPPKAESI